MSEQDAAPTRDFIRQIINEDLAAGKHQQIITRFPPEPNGYLHLGHAKAICLNFGIAQEYQGKCYLRFDDTNPVKEDTRFTEAIKADIAWLGYEWEDERYASDYFQQLYDWAVSLIERGLAYVDELNPEQIREYRGTLTEPGKPSPYRERSIEDNLACFKAMRDGKYEDGGAVLRAKIDMASPNMNMRDPALYRVKRATHHRTGDDWCIYPMYDFAHGQSDAIEHVTHSLCSLEFEDHRPLYEWLIEHLDTPSNPRQIEFARLQPKYTITSKRKLAQLIDEGLVDGWDDPRVPTLAGMRRRGFTPASIRDFCARVGVTKSAAAVEMSLLEFCVREDLNSSAPRAMAVIDPLKVTITNYDAEHVETCSLPWHPQQPERGDREMPFCNEVYIEKSDFMEEAPKKFFRLKPGGEVRLRGAYVIQCDEVIKDDNGEVVELRCSYDPDTRSGTGTSTKKVKGTIHWVSARHAVPAEVRLYDRLFTVPAPDARNDEGKTFLDYVNPDSLTVMGEALLEPGIEQLPQESHIQFERNGYFVTDRHEHRSDKPVFNRVVPLRDTWGKIEKQHNQAQQS